MIYRSLSNSQVAKMYVDKLASWVIAKILIVVVPQLRHSLSYGRNNLIPQNCGLLHNILHDLVLSS